jgi:hypothetical protein
MAGNNNHAAGQGGFDSRAEQAFNQGNSSGPPQGGQQYANGHYNGGGNNNNNNNHNSANHNGYAGAENGSDPFSFLSSGMNNLGINENDNRRGNQNNAKSPQ